MRIIFFGDITGKSGRQAIVEILPKLRDELAPDFIVANIENAAHGKGVTPRIVATLLESGIDFFTSGNHIFSKRSQAEEVFSEFPDRIIRPANFSDSLPGKGYAKVKVGKNEVLMLNLNGQVFMETQFDDGEIANPFQKLDQILGEVGDVPKINILDFHAEATSEKRAMGLYADGRLSAVLGTHTHVQSGDAQILPQGTGYLTDLGMVGVRDSVIGADAEGVMAKFLEGEKTSKGPITVAESDRYEVGYCVLEIDEETGKCKNIYSKLIFT